MRIVAIGCLIALLLAVSPCGAADKWFVIKDANDVCKVIEAKEKTPKTVAGPFSSKAQAEEAKEKACKKMKWFVIKDVKDVCKVIEAEDKTPKTIGGPFNTKADAETAKEKLCKQSKK